ncbi:nucleotidyl transferase AbiEii/AbiGii toxin family protein [Peristeroidobacter soli]|uniref:nucleotidyl transferase AbiEii/AbiGii toxin family protein n=1 Tax=Peristeroidobacter soli TaxID=2497877 RepID=UPI001300720B|nr:nucleotidyl transferase AbiEii/AbiGii toxin family protein [Peristeroidobacter soli]
MDSKADLRNAFQERLLAAIYKARQPGELILKGGGAMKVRTDSARFTQDIDLDHDPRRGLDSLVKSIRKAIDQAFVGGFKKLQVTEPKQTDTVARWKIHGQGPKGEDFQLTVEVSRRHAINQEEIETALLQIRDRSFSSRVYIDIYRADKLAEMKLYALLDDNRIAPRDIYDLDLLIGEGAAPSGEAMANLQAKYGDVSGQLIKKLAAMPWPLFESQTLSVIPDALRLRINEVEYAAMQERILNEVMKWTAQPARSPGP